ncbi:MAG: DUF222 domain-containing protein, partial [Haloechinothrix sp.]
MIAKLDIIDPKWYTTTAAVEVSGVLSMMWSADAESHWRPEGILGLEGVDWAHFGADHVVELISASQALVARVQAVQLQAVEELRQRRGDDRDTGDEVAFALSVSKHAGDKQVHLAKDLTARFPKVLEAMGRGEVDSYKASRICDTALPLPDEQARELDSHLESRVAGRDATAIQQSARRKVDALDPDGAARRAERRRKDRKVELIPAEDSMAHLSAYLPADVACSIYARVDAIAKSIKTRRDERSMDEIRADVFAELLLGKNQSGKTVQINVTVPVTTLLGSSELPADLEGYGWIPADIARQLAADPKSTWRRLLTDPATGQLLEVGRTRYTPPAQLDEYVRVRDQRCRVPGCRRPARKCDLDHNHDWGKGGETAECLLCSLCRRHHLLKDRPGWNFQMIHGDLIITTPTGKR